MEKFTTGEAYMEGNLVEHQRYSGIKVITGEDILVNQYHSARGKAVGDAR